MPTGAPQAAHISSGSQDESSSAGVKGLSVEVDLKGTLEEGRPYVLLGTPSVMVAAARRQGRDLVVGPTRVVVWKEEPAL